MTKQQAYQIMIEIYQWEHDNPFEDYYHSPIFKKYEIKKMQCHCAIANHYKTCEECPMSFDPHFKGCSPLTAIKSDCILYEDKLRYKRICNIFINAFKLELKND